MGSYLFPFRGCCCQSSFSSRSNKARSLVTLRATPKASEELNMHHQAYVHQLAEAAASGFEL